MGTYAVIDVETTGLSPALHHRVVEVAVVLVDSQGYPVYEWDTLLNPEREVDASEIHGLRGADLYAAPTFDQIAGELGLLLADRALVGHNVSFDIGFLAAEFQRLGVKAPFGAEAGLCTMHLAREYLPLERHSLGVCCAHIGHPVKDAHSALGDARATAELFAYYLRKVPGVGLSCGRELRKARKRRWPKLPPRDSSRLTRQDSRAKASSSFVSCLATGQSCEIGNDAIAEYLELLDWALLDLHLSYHEKDALVATANRIGLSQAKALDVHRRYLVQLTRNLQGPHGVATQDRESLVRVAGILEVESELIDKAIAGGGIDDELGASIGRFSLTPGDAVVFTGAAPGVSREELAGQARELGLRVTGSVSGRTRLLVAADPDSLSSKARRARQLDIPIVDYDTYSRMLESVG